MTLALPILNVYYLISNQYIHSLQDYWLFLRGLNDLDIAYFSNFFTSKNHTDSKQSCGEDQEKSWNKNKRRKSVS